MHIKKLIWLSITILGMNSCQYGRVSAYKSPTTDSVLIGKLYMDSAYISVLEDYNSIEISNMSRQASAEYMLKFEELVNQVSQKDSFILRRYQGKKAKQVLQKMRQK